MSVDARDPHTGYLTTGHEWNGITELNTPVPRAIYFFLTAAVTFALIGWILWPAWPLGTTYTKGILGSDQRKSVTEALEREALEHEVWSKRIETESFADIQRDPALMTVVRETGHRLFGDNCAPCHGANAQGQQGFPNLTTTSWLWGGTPDAIAETIRIGINAPRQDTRASQMPAWGHDQLLPRGDIEKVAAYVLSLSSPSATAEAPPGTIEAGKAVFKANCVICHGEDAKGKTEVGAPDLTHKFWIYGGDPQSVFASIWGGRQGHMPSWESRLPLLSRKILALYLVDLRGAAP
jgi:cytochrome c oxidase cbb3-type subunit 3